MEHLILFFPSWPLYLINSLFPPSLHFILYIRVFSLIISLCIQHLCILVVVVMAVVKYRCWLGEYYNA